MRLFPRPLALALALLSVGGVLPGRAQAGGYGELSWGESVRSVAKKLKGERLVPRPDAEPVAFEAQVLREEHVERVRQAVVRKKPAKEIARLRKTKPARARFSAQSHWTALGALDARVLLLFHDERLASVELNVPFRPTQRAAAGELLDLLAAKYGAPKEHRGAEAPTAPVVDVFEAGDTQIEAYQQPAAGGRSGLLHLVYRGREQRDALEHTLEDLRERLDALMLARHPPGPTPEEREAARKAALLRRL